MLPAQEPVAPAIACYSETCYRMYSRCASTVADLDRLVEEFVASPDEDHLERTRIAWLKARRAYCRTEALRFYGGPIDDIEPLVNAWPVDEAYIDSIEGRDACGIIHDETQYPRIHETVLALANERGGEANISVGWHSIEFLLWGQDLQADGPGARKATDFVDGLKPRADRRRQYLRAVSSLLRKHMREIQAAWAPDADNFRRRFEADGDALRKAFTGLLVFTAFELGGERLAVAYETKDQEQEHSCFSDASCADLVEGQAGLMSLLTGMLDGERLGPGLLSALEAKDQECADMVRKRFEATAAAIAKIPHPFDQAILGDDDAPGRRALLAAIEALEQQAEALTFAGHVLGYQLPLRPGN